MVDLASIAPAKDSTLLDVKSAVEGLGVDAAPLVSERRDGQVILGSSTTAATILVGPLNTDGYESLIVDFREWPAGSPSAVVETSNVNDPSVSWVPCYGRSANGYAGTSNIASIVPPAVWVFPVVGKYVRVKYNAAGASGPMTVAVRLSKQVVAPGIQVQIEGRTAEGASDNSHVPVGGKVRTQIPTASRTHNQNVPFAMSENLQLLTRPYADAALSWAYFSPSGGDSGTGNKAIKAAVVSTRAFPTYLSILNKAGGTDSEFELFDGSTVIWRDFIPVGERLTVDLGGTIKGAVNVALSLRAVTSTTYYATVLGHMGR